MKCHCGTEFEPKRKDQVNCSRRCNNNASSRRFNERNRKPRQVYRRYCASTRCGRRFETRNPRKDYCHKRCAYYIAWRFRREAKRSGWAA